MGGGPRGMPQGWHMYKARCGDFQVQGHHGVHRQALLLGLLSMLAAVA
eukprot:CAMPEP_0197660094 /NCGR_PEP_ID=MMETSP1338-20131121/50440_1 /TAXON_ID=43686 ORGANISM="Pelagodinium beii, Strain RCC1491" /NCGR_SAMPLE_ID=MMETSP1338 /ASSEMBLY_ACC=CAM_ASM_000754 /LENGTH=47 /DNA_ID= /DNA_START= /DNA_END= /DNA_ORIENTATION=